MMMVLDGKLLYLKMVKGENDTTYLKLKERFEILVNGGTKIKKEKIKAPIGKNIVDLIFEIGLNEAMKKY